MPLGMLCVAGIAGAALGLRRPVLILVPATAITILAVFGLELYAGTSGWDTWRWIALSGAALQVGYIAGTLLAAIRLRRTLTVLLPCLALIPPDAFGFSMHLGDIELEPVGLALFCQKKPLRCAQTKPEVAQIMNERWRQLAAVNASVNRSIAPLPDLSLIRP